MARLQDTKDEVIHLRSAGVDLGKWFLLACVRVPSAKRAGSWSLETERFGTTTAEVRRLLAWLLERQAEVVVMEATSDYWRPVYYLLQPHLNLMLVNPAHLKGIRSRKTDPSDAAFLARAGASGMVMASFVPGRDIRELRDLTRRRTELARAAGWETQRLEKELKDTGMKLSSVLSDVAGATGRAILGALISGERDPRVRAWSPVLPAPLLAGFAPLLAALRRLDPADPPDPQSAARSRPRHHTVLALQAFWSRPPRPTCSQPTHAPPASPPTPVASKCGLAKSWASRSGASPASADPRTPNSSKPGSPPSNN
ncbi:transposase [Streptomyces populi]